MLAYCVFNASSAAVSLYQPLLSRWQLNSLKTRASRKVQFSQLRKLRDLDLRLGQGHTVRISGRCLPTHKIISKSEKLFVDVWTYGLTDGHTWVPIYWVIAWQWPKNYSAWLAVKEKGIVNYHCIRWSRLISLTDAQQGKTWQSAVVWCWCTVRS